MIKFTDFEIKSVLDFPSEPNVFIGVFNKWGILKVEGWRDETEEERGEMRSMGGMRLTVVGIKDE